MPILLIACCFICGCGRSANAFTADSPQNCQIEEYRGNQYFICRFLNYNKNLKLYWRDQSGNIYGNFANLNHSLQAKGHELVFAMNGGMYHYDYSPVGLFIENSKQKAKLKTKKSFGNFGLLPNGVFVINNGKAEVLETSQYADKYSQNPPQYATQSGPMLVTNNEIHPMFNPSGTSLNIRNGVGISPDGHEIYFAISNDEVNFYDFATMFKDYLQSPNALYLDGSISKVFDKESGRNDVGDNMGVIIAISN